MATLNKTKTSRVTTAHRTVPRTHQGAPACSLSPEAALRRSVMSCMLWEKTFYEDGVSIGSRIEKLVSQVDPKTVVELAIEARNEMNLRHAPLLLTAALAKNVSGDANVRALVPKVVRRADELSELLAIHAEINGVGPDRIKEVLDRSLRRGLADAFVKFDAYALAKYDRNQPIRLRDVLFLTHPKPQSEEQAQTWKQLAEGTLSSPDTWEVALSAGGDKKAEFERLLREDKLGYLALLRNLRNMVDAGVDMELVRSALAKTDRASRVLPFRFVAAARHVPQLEKSLDSALIAQISNQKKLPGKTVVLVDVSGSMSWSSLSRKSDMKSIDAAATLASVIPAEDLRVFTFSTQIVEVPPRMGMAGVDAVKNSQMHGGTRLGEAVKHVNRLKYDRLIVITDEQSHDTVPGPAHRGYMINVANYKNGVGYGPWVHIDGFSESVIKYIQAIEEEKLV